MVGWLQVGIHQLFTNNSSIESFVLVSMFGRVIVKSQSSYDYDSFRHPLLTHDEKNNGARLGIDTWADTACAGKHAYVEELVIDKVVTASGFTP